MENAIHIGNKVDEAGARELREFILAILQTSAGDMVKVEAIKAAGAILPPVKGLHITNCNFDGSTNYLGDPPEGNDEE